MSRLTTAETRKGAGTLNRENQADFEVALCEIARRGFEPGRTPPPDSFPADGRAERFRLLGSDLWFDSGNLAEVKRRWVRGFTHLTTNNTLVWSEVKEGKFDSTIAEAAAEIRRLRLTMDEDELVMAVGFVVNARVANALVQELPARVSVELHPAIADDLYQTVRYGTLYYAVNPERFIIKVPFTPAGLIAARILSLRGVPVNLTTTFSARQAALVAAVANTSFTNVFMGRLSEIAKKYSLGDPAGIGEKATMSAQVALNKVKLQNPQIGTKLIGASLRSGSQLVDLAGMDVFTMPLNAWDEFLKMEINPDDMASQVGRNFKVNLKGDAGHAFGSLWNVPEGFWKLVWAIGHEAVEAFTPDDVVDFTKSFGLSDLWYRWTESELAKVKKDGKIPDWEGWKSALDSGDLGLDALMTEAAKGSFGSDQDKADEYYRKKLRE
jgi:transaldolase